jgi:nucleoside triphosphate pyrophosphatase
MADDSVSSRPPLWSGADPLVLASKSASRRALLNAAGLAAKSVAVDIDERALEDRFLGDGGSLERLAAELARAKALAASALRPEAYCLGADQTLTLEDRLLHKPRDLTEAAHSLAALAGRTHRLISAFSIARSGAILVVDQDSADLHMRNLDARAIAQYLDLAGHDVVSSVGAYRLEGLGVHLFDRVDGDHATILGVPMLKLLAWLRGQDLISL